MEGKIYHITKEKLKELQGEYDKLVLLDKERTVGEEAPKMIESDDMNPEFVSFQENVNSTRARLEELENIFKNHQLIKAPPKDKRTLVSLGAKVQIDKNGKSDEFMIVGTLEADPIAGKISNESPVGRALLGKKAGDEIVISSPEKMKYKIRSVRYEIS